MTDNPIFNEFFDLLHTLEGGLSNDSADRGGRTKYGVSTPLFNQVKDKYSINYLIEQLTIEDAKKIYEGEFFKPIRLVDNKEAYYLYFDLCVNSGFGNYKKCYGIADSNKPETIYKWREQFFKDIVNKDPTQKRFLKGWLNRLSRIKQYFKENK
jgi:hypothetical protein